MIRLLPLLLLAGCHPRMPWLSLPEPGVQAVTASPVKGVLFLQGFDAAWNIRPHRVRRLGFSARGALLDAGAGPAGLLHAELRGGSWASGERADDVPLVTLRYGTLTAPDLTVVAGQVDLLLHGGRRVDTPWLEPAEDEVLDIPLPEGGPWQAAAAWITGFDIYTGLSHPNGYTVHSLGVSLGEPTIVDDHARLRIAGRIEAGPVIDRRQQLGSWGATVAVHYALVLSRVGHATRLDLGTRLERGAEEQPGRLHRVAPVQLPFEISTQPDLPVAVAGLSAFSLDFVADGPVAGRYIRALTAAILDERHDPARGVFQGMAALRFSNAGELPRPARADASITTTVLELPAGARVHRGLWIPETEAQASCARYPDLDPIPCPEPPEP